MKKLKVIYSALVSSLMLAPAFALAQAPAIQLSGLSQALDSLSALMNKVIPILIGAAVVVFLFGVLKYVFNAGSEDARKEGRTFMIYGIIAIAIMLSVWALVAFVRNTFGIQNSSAPSGNQLPNVPTR